MSKHLLLDGIVLGPYARIIYLATNTDVLRASVGRIDLASYVVSNICSATKDTIVPKAYYIFSAAKMPFNAFQ